MERFTETIERLYQADLDESSAETMSVIRHIESLIEVHPRNDDRDILNAILDTAQEQYEKLLEAENTQRMDETINAIASMNPAEYFPPMQVTGAEDIPIVNPSEIERERITVEDTAMAEIAEPITLNELELLNSYSSPRNVRAENSRLRGSRTHRITRPILFPRSSWHLADGFSIVHRKSLGEGSDKIIPITWFDERCKECQKMASSGSSQEDIDDSHEDCHGFEHEKLSRLINFIDEERVLYPESHGYTCGCSVCDEIAGGKDCPYCGL